MREQRHDTHAPSNLDKETDEELTPSLEDEDAEIDESDARSRLHFVSTIPARAWIAVALVCLLAAVACLLVNRPSAAFVAGVLGVVAWFLNVRVQLQDVNHEGGADGDEN